VRQVQSQCEPKLYKVDGTPVTDWGWTSETTDTFWNKFHDYYQPLGLFNNNFSLASPAKCKFAGVIYTSPFHQLKYEALGVQVKVKKGNATGVGRIDERIHIGTSKSTVTHYLKQDSEIEDAAVNNMEGDSSDEEEDDDDLSTVDVKEYFMEK
jgi:hypothetical protein